MRGRLWAVLIGAVLVLGGATRARAQVVLSGGAATYGLSPYYAPPGYYGTAWGYPGFGTFRAYSSYASSFGLGYGYGLGPYSYLPGAYGVEMWRPGFVAPGYAYGAPAYRTFPIRVGLPPAPIGLYAPAYGPPYGPFPMLGD